LDSYHVCPSLISDTASGRMQKLTLIQVLAKAGIVPSLTATYTYDQIQAAIKAAHGYEITIQCSAGALDELWYYYNVLGSVQTGEFVPAPPGKQAFLA
jgi:ribonuclease T2